MQKHNYTRMDNTSKSTTRRLMMMAVLLTMSLVPLQAQTYYTLTNGRVYWWEGSESVWDKENYAEHLTTMAYDASKGYEEVHPYDRANVTHVTQIGTKYLALDLSDGYASPKIVAKSTGFNVQRPTTNNVEGKDLIDFGGDYYNRASDEFDAYCVWLRTGNTGYYYQEWTDPGSDGTPGTADDITYRYYLRGERGQLTVEAVPVGSSIEIKYWYNWDFGAAIKEVSFRNGASNELDFWLYYNENSDTWTVSDDKSYERPEALYYTSSYQYITSTDTPEQIEEKNLANAASMLFYYGNREEKDLGGVVTKRANTEKVGNAALYLPVTVEAHGRQISEIEPGVGLTGATTVLKDSDPEVVIGTGMGEQPVYYGQTVKVTPTINLTGSSTAKVVEAYTRYGCEYFRYGIHTNYRYRSTATFNSSGIPDSNEFYLYSDGSIHEVAPTSTDETLVFESMTFELSRKSKRFLTLNTEGTGMSQKAILQCINQPNENYTAELYITILYEGGFSQKLTVQVPLSSSIDAKTFPTEPVSSPLIAGKVFGGGRMANVGGSTSVTLHHCDTLRYVYGGNDIAGWVQGDHASIYVGSAVTDADHPVRVGHVYGGGCGLYTYTNVYDANTGLYTGDDVAVTGLAFGNYCFGKPSDGVNPAVAGKVYPWGTQSGDLATAEPVVDVDFTYSPYTGPDWAHNENGDGGNGSIPYVKSSFIDVGYAGGTGNDYVLVDTLFGGAENAFIGIDHDGTLGRANAIDVYGGTVYALFGGNNYGGAVAQKATTLVTVHNTKLPAVAPVENIFNTPYHQYGRDYGIRYLFGGGNLVTSTHAEVLIEGGMIDTCFLGGNRATVSHPLGIVNCTGDNYIYSNPHITDLTGTVIDFGEAAKTDEGWAKLLEVNPGAYDYGVQYNVRSLFGGNNKAPMTSLSRIVLNSGGVANVYGGGNEGDMRNTVPITDASYKQYKVLSNILDDGANVIYEKDQIITASQYDALTPAQKAQVYYFDFEDIIYNKALAGWKYFNSDKPLVMGSVVYSWHDSRIMAECVYGGSRMANVRNSSGVFLNGGCFGYVHGGNDVSGDVGSETDEGSWAIIDSNAIVLQDVYGGSDGYYHCKKDGRYIITEDAVTSYTDIEYDPYDDYIGLLAPTQNNAHLYVKGGNVLFSLYGGGVMTDIGEPSTGSLSIFLRDSADFTGVNAGQEYTKGYRRLNVKAGEKSGSIHFQISGGQMGSEYYHHNAGSAAQARKAALASEYRANHDGNAYGGGYLSNLNGLAYFYINQSPRIYGSVFAGNDCMGSIENFGAYTFEGGDQATLTSSITDPANPDSELLNRPTGGGKYEAKYSSYVLIEGSPLISCVYGSGNGAYNYHMPERPEYSDEEPVCMQEAVDSRPYQQSTFIDIHTTGGMIDTVFGGGNGVGVRESAKVLFNSTQKDVATVGTIFGGNNRDDMTQCVPELAMAKGKVNTIYGGGNAGGMGCLNVSVDDICGNPVDSVSTHIRFTSPDVTVTGSVFGGCRMANVAGKAFVEVRQTSDAGIQWLYGGNDISGDVTGNTRIDVSGGTVHNIFGGGNGYYDYVKLGDHNYNVYNYNSTHNAANLIVEGATGEPFVDSTTVNLHGGTISTDVYGGGRLADCRATLVDVNDKLCPANYSDPLDLNGSVYGGGKGVDDDLNAVRRGNVVQTDYGAGATHVNLRSAHSLASATAYGGGRGGDVENTYITVFPTWEATLGALYGGCWGSDVYGSTHVIVEGDDPTDRNNVDYVYGGNDFTGNVYKTDVEIRSGRIGTLYGGGNGVYEASEYTSGVYAAAGKQLQVPNNEYAEINFLGGTATGNVYGGGSMGTTMVYKKYAVETDDATGHHYVGEYILDANGRKQADTAMTVAEAYDNSENYSYILVNVHGGEFVRNIFGGARGETGMGQLVYGLKQVNMDGATTFVRESVYGGSESVNDGYVECASTASTTRRPSSILNIAGGTVTNNVYGGGYLGDVRGSAYVNVGVEAIENSPVWNYTIAGQENAYIMFKPGYSYTSAMRTYNGHVGALNADEVNLISSIYAGANWGNNTGSADFTKAGFKGGETRIFIDGTGYKTFMTEDEDGLNQMNIGKSVICSGTSAEGGDIYRRVDIHHYGAINPMTCKPTRTLRAIQRADAVYLDNTAIDYTGSTDAISAYLSNQVTLNRIDSINCVGYNVIDVDATVTNIKAVNFYKDNFDGEGNEIWPYYGKDLTYTDRSLKDYADACKSSPTTCDQLQILNRTESPSNNKALTAFLMNNGINVDFVYSDALGTQVYSPVKGFAYIMAEPFTNAIISGKSKYERGMWDDALDGEEYGGFMPTCRDSASTFTASGTYDEILVWTYNPSNSSAEYPYNNYNTNYRVWSVGNGVRRRYAVITAHAEPNKLPAKNEGFTSTSPTLDLAVAYAPLELPPASPGHYYKISAAGVTIDDVNDEMRLAGQTWNPYKTITKSWSATESPRDIETNGGWEGETSGINAYDISNNPGTYFGLLMSSGNHFSDAAKNYPLTHTTTRGLTLISGNQTVNQLNNFTTYIVGDENFTTPVLDLYLTYAPDFGNTLIGTVTFTLEECEVAITRNTDGKPLVDTTGGTFTLKADAFDPADFSKIAVNSEGYLVSSSDPAKYVDLHGDEIIEEDRIRTIYDKSLNTDIWVEVTISTVLEKFNNIKHELLAMYNEGRSNVFSRKTILPATLEPRDIFIEGIEWGPTDMQVGSAGLGNGAYSTWTDPSDPTTYFSLTNDSSSIVNQADGLHNLFSILIQPVDDVSTSLTTSEGWKNISGDMTKLRDIVELTKGATPDTYNYSAGSASAPTPISLKSGDGEKKYGQYLGTLDGRGESGIDIVLHYDGSRIYNTIPNKGYVGKAVLHMVSYLAGMRTDPNEFDIEVYVKTRAHGDTIYVASTNSYTWVDGSDVEHAYTPYDFSAPSSNIELDKPGKRPSKYINDINRALQSDIYQEGDVVAVLDTVVISSDKQLRIRGYEYAPLQVIRYYGHHTDAPGEKNVYRGTMFDVRGSGATFNAVCVDFIGSAIGKLETGPLANQLQLQTDELRVKYADTNVAFAPILRVHNGGVVQIANGTIIEENYNMYNGTDHTLYGAVNVGRGGTFQLRNNNTIKNNLSRADITLGGYTDGLTDDATHHPLNGAVYVDGGTVYLKESNNASKVLIQDNYLFEAGTEYWTQVKDKSDNLVRFAFDSNPTKVDNYDLANVFLTRTETSKTGTYNKKMYDTQSDMIMFDNNVPQGTRIGVRKWFPGLNVRDTIHIAFEPNGVDLTTVFNNGIFTSDDGYFVFANAGVHDEFIYLQRCATFQMQGHVFSDISTDPVYTPYTTTYNNDAARLKFAEMTPGQTLNYKGYKDGTCPRGGDTLSFRVQGGFLPYNYTWTLKEGATGDVNTVRTSSTHRVHGLVRADLRKGDTTSLAAAVEDRLISSSVDLELGTSKTLYYTVTAQDTTGNCVLRKNIEVKVNLDKTDAPAVVFTDPDGSGTAKTYWQSTELPNIADPSVVTAHATRNYHGVEVTPVVWTRGSGVILAKTFNSTNDSVYFIDDDTKKPFDDVLFCQGDQIRLVTRPHRDGEDKPTSRFIMWDFDPYYSDAITYTVPTQDATVVAYYGPLDYWKDAINTTTLGGVRYDNTNEYEVNGSKGVGDKFVVTRHGDVHIYDEDGLAWFISSVNGLNGTQATTYHFNNVYLHQKDGGYDMKDHLWTPVGTAQHAFEGQFFGVANTWNATEPLASDYVTVKNIIVDEPYADMAGFFGRLQTGVVKSVKFESALIRGSQHVGTVAAESKGSVLEHVAVASAFADGENHDETDGLASANVITVITTRHTSGGLIGNSTNDKVTNSDVQAKYVGEAVYTGGVVGYGTGKNVVSNTSVRNTNLMSAIYSGGIAGYLEGEAPKNGLFRRAKGKEGNALVMNNYVHYTSTGANEQAGGLVGYAKYATVANNYVHGAVDATVRSAAVAATLDEGATATYNYYADGTARAEVGNTLGSGSAQETHSFSGSGNQVRLADNSRGVDNLTRALNLWVKEQGDDYRTWRSDLEGTNSGYPIFGTPDLIPVKSIEVIEGCDSVVVDDQVYYFDAEAETHVVDSLLMVDSTAHLVIHVHHSSREQYADSTVVGNDYQGYGFVLTAAETELLRSTIRQYGHATLTLTDTLQSSTGCDSIVCLTLTVNDDGNTNVDIDEPVVKKRVDIKVYPNPTTGRVTVETEAIQHVELYDNEGRLLQDYTTDERDRIVIDLTGYATGAYYLRVHTDQEVTIQKLIKK